jgi:hypothetical protein
VSEVAKGLRQQRFFDLSDRDKRDILKLMARVAEQAYRRGVQQGAGLAGKSSFRGDLWEWRYRPSLDLSPCVRRRQRASIGSTPNVASRCGGSGSPRTTAMPAGGGRAGPIAGGVPSGSDTHPSSAPACEFEPAPQQRPRQTQGGPVERRVLM